MGQKKVDLYYNFLTPWNYQFPNPKSQFPILRRKRVEKRLVITNLLTGIKIPIKSKKRIKKNNHEITKTRNLPQR